MLKNPSKYRSDGSLFTHHKSPVIVTDRASCRFVVRIEASVPHARILSILLVFTHPSLENAVDVAVMQEEERVVARNRHVGHGTSGPKVHHVVHSVKISMMLRLLKVFFRCVLASLYEA